MKWWDIDKTWSAKCSQLFFGFAVTASSFSHHRITYNTLGETQWLCGSTARKKCKRQSYSECLLLKEIVWSWSDVCVCMCLMPMEPVLFLHEVIRKWKKERQNKRVDVPKRIEAEQCYGLFESEYTPKQWRHGLANMPSSWSELALQCVSGVYILSFFFNSYFALLRISKALCKYIAIYHYNCIYYKPVNKLRNFYSGDKNS